ncbi:HsdM family class I SAM-dependent methyltransferase [Cohnella silvisoli]|uniref:N-6 DNA methylase n=1 Tax=Cohnella silvisoli TaxID=2873699 RepID=A0ABV1KYW7_9BACL|nr:N-6 DNA methylase [Cohnella silvisoli]MCD9024340.1 N-6 DNA methylase [Cohnella silvisoli]
MGKADRKRWDGNVRSMAIIAKADADITADDLSFLRENYTSAGGLIPNAYSGGAFFTPTHVARFIVEALRGLSGGFSAGQTWLEPSCGSGVFLEHVPAEAEVTALELDVTSARVASLLYSAANVIQGDALTHDRRDYYDFVIGNPPYGVNIDIAAEELPDDYVTLTKKARRARGKSEFAFIELAIKAAKPGGYIALVLPKGIGFSSAGAKLRDLTRESCWHIASVELPGTTFAHVGTTISTDIHILRKVTPNARKVHVKYTQAGGGRFVLDTVVQSEPSESTMFWYEGQAPVLHAVITDIGYDKDGKSTDKWDDGLTQLDELLEAFTDTLIRENSDPIAPHKGETHAFSVRVPPHEEWRTKRGEYAYWNVLTLGRGEDIAVDGGSPESSFDLDWQDRIVASHYAELERTSSATITETITEVAA